MKKFSAALLGVLVLSSTLPAAFTPAFALGGCGRNGHLGPGGRCVFGGQNQDFCLRTTGHVARRAPDGTMRCYH